MVKSKQVEITDMVKSFGAFHALKSVNLGIDKGEIIALLGPSGCGKTTLLRCIAGLEQPTSGKIAIDGKLVFSGADNLSEPPEKRKIGLVFQSYALWPHMTVAENVGYGLKMLGVPKAQAQERVAKILDTVGLAGFGDRHPSTMSGGQQQRVALARSLVVEASVILFDEPLSNLDLKLREEMRFELRQLINRIGVTAIFVTHDQSEAMVLADRICLMRSGEIIQTGTPREVYNHPETRFAMDFLGSANFIEGDVSGGGITLRDGKKLQVAQGAEDCNVVGIRPEKIKLLAQGARASNRVEGTIIDTVFLGISTTYLVDIGSTKLQVSSVEAPFSTGDNVVLDLPPQDLKALID